MDFWLVWEYAAILLSVVAGLKDPLLCRSRRSVQQCRASPLNGGSAAALEESSMEPLSAVAVDGGDGGAAHIALYRADFCSKKD